MSYPATAVPSGGNYPGAYTRASLLTTEPSQTRSGGTKNGFLFLWCPAVRGREPQVQGHVKGSGVQGFNLGPHSHKLVLCAADPCVLAPNTLPKESPTPQVAGHALSEFVKRYVCGHFPTRFTGTCAEADHMKVSRCLSWWTVCSHGPVVAEHLVRTRQLVLTIKIFWDFSLVVLSWAKLSWW